MMMSDVSDDVVRGRKSEGYVEEEVVTERVYRA